MYKVFLSSTSKDLADYREAVHRALDGLPGFQLIKMEDFGARDAIPKDLCVRLVRESDLLVGLMGHYYGSCPPNEAVSFTELEYRTATKAKLPRLMFVAPDEFPIPAKLRESDDSFQRQQALRDEVMTDLVVASFATPEQLASAVTKALFVWHEEQRRGEQPAAGESAKVTEPTTAGPVSEKPLGQNPYRGLEAFRKEDAERFFGRETLVDQLWSAFLALHAAPTDDKVPTRLLTILGASGSGKSSVAQAGLLAKLDRDPLPGRPAPIDVLFTPEARPLESLAVALARQATDEPAPAMKASEFEEILRHRANRDGLRFLAERMLDAGGAGLILLVDQFEELYSLCDDEAERAAFIGNLLQAAQEQRGRISIILTLRSDFLGAVNQHPELSGLIARQNVVVPVMGDEELRRAIEEPAKRAGREIDPGTVDLLIEQTLDRECALPLLEFVLTRIWDGFGRGASAANTVRELGGVGGALANQAQAVYESLDPEDRQIARRAFLAMVRLGEGTRDTRRRARIAEMVTGAVSDKEVLFVLRRFAEPECRLITLSGEGKAATAEVTHEALLETWRPVQEWLRDSRDDWRFYRRVADAASHWDALGRPEGSLWRPPELELLRSFQRRARDDLTALQIAFFEASEQAISLANQKEREREAEKQRLATVQLIAQRRRRAAVLMAGLAVLAVGSAVLAYKRGVEAEAQRVAAETGAEAANRERQRAQEQRTRALTFQSLLLASLSREQTENGNATVGAILALETLPKVTNSRDRPYVAEAEAALYSALANRRETWIASGHEAAVLSAAFSPDMTAVATASADGTLRIWDAVTGKERGVLNGHGGSVNSVAFHPEGTQIVSASDDRTARLWDVATLQQTIVLWGHRGNVKSATFSPDGNSVLTASDDGTARLWDAATGRELSVFEGPELVANNWASFSPDGKKIIVALNDGTARILDTKQGHELNVLQHYVGWVNSAVYSPDGVRIVTAASDGTARLWNADTGDPMGILKGHELPVQSARFGPSGTTILTAGSDGAARLWTEKSSGFEFELFTVLGGHEAGIRTATFSRDGTNIVTASSDGTARLFSVASKLELAAIGGGGHSVLYLEFSPDGSKVATASVDGTARLWDAASGKELLVLRGHEGRVNSASFSPKGAHLVTTGYDRSARIWDTASGTPVAALIGHEAEVLSAAFSSDGRYVVTGSNDRTARVWDVSTEQELIALSGHRGPVQSAEFVRHTAWVMTISSDGTARLWDPEIGEPLIIQPHWINPESPHSIFSKEELVPPEELFPTEELFGCEGDLFSFSCEGGLFSFLEERDSNQTTVGPGGMRRVTTSEFGPAQLWDVASGQELAALAVLGSRVLSALFSPDGTKLALLCSDGRARIWRVLRTTQELINHARSVVPPELTAKQRKEFFLE